ncbi:MAG: Tol-Pal system beta propeller repeat protein TolB [Deltaproteobacteria bacterium]|nr:Tol-Pal system beta propeller repeat protein TolB [Deltaproteobacteria bacterium]
MRRRAAIVLLLVGLLLALGGTGAGQKVYLDINAPGFKRLPIAIAPLVNLARQRGGDRVGEEIAQVLTYDLEASGLFKVLDPISFIEDPARAGIEREQIEFRDWSLIGAEALVKGTVALDGSPPGELRVQFRLFDVVDARSLTGKEYRAQLRDVRKVAHRMANEILYQFTGEEGVFETRIAFVSTRTGNKELFLMDYDGFGVQQLTSHRSINLSPAWTPDGRSLTFTSFRAGEPQLFRLNLAAGQLLRLSASPGLNVGAAWAPDGRRLALTLSRDGNPELYVMDRDGGGLQRLTRHPGIDVSPTWSPDGQEIAFVSDRTGNPQIFVLTLRTGDLRRLTFQGSYNASPAWSPRGDRIAYACRTESSFDICTISPDGSNSQRLTFAAGNNEHPSWSPDGRHLVFASNRATGRYALYRMLANGSNLTRIATGSGEDLSPAWSPRLRE